MIKKHWQIFFIESLILLIFILFYGRFGDINIDSFREAYIAEEVIKGKILYKDIFTIYAPFSYLFNALLFLIFGAKLKVLYFAGLFTTMGIFYFVYKLSQKFLDKFLSFAVMLFLLSAMVLSPNVFNTFFPYSYGILYGLFFALASIYYLFTHKYPLAYLFYSLAVCSKYEFLFLLPVLIFVNGVNNWKKNLSAMALPAIMVIPFIKYLPTTLQILNTMSSTKTLYWFYSIMGLTFRLEIIPIYIINILKFIFPIYWIGYQEILIWAFPVILIGLILQFKKLSYSEKIFITAAILISLKVFFALTLQSYGVFFLPFALISLGILAPKKKVLSVLLIIWAIIVGSGNIQGLLNKNIEIKTEKGIIKTSPTWEEYKEVINFTQTTKKDAKVIVYPEGLVVNFLADRVSDNKFYSLIPLYVETFGEDLIIKRLEKFKPDYIIITDYDTSAYYYKKFGEDYAAQIMAWINKNYSSSFSIARFKIFRSNFL